MTPTYFWEVLYWLVIVIARNPKTLPSKSTVKKSKKICGLYTLYDSSSLPTMSLTEFAMVSNFSPPWFMKIMFFLFNWLIICKNPEVGVSISVRFNWIVEFFLLWIYKLLPVLKIGVWFRVYCWFRGNDSSVKICLSLVFCGKRQ